MYQYVAVGFLGGGLVVALLFYFLKVKRGQGDEEAVRAKEEQLSVEIQRLREEIRTKERNLLEISQEKAAAVQKSLMIPKLEEQIQRLEEEKKGFFRQISELQSQKAELEATLREEKKAWEEKFLLLEEARQKLGDAFEALSAKVLRHSQESFLREAKITLEKFHNQATGELEKRKQAIGELVRPIQELLHRYEKEIQEMERARREAYGGLKAQVESLLTTQRKLEAETSNLVRALRAPQVRGRWGEITLKRVAELAGMVEHCDFYEQESMATEEGRLRPDMIVRLPGGKQIVVDAKVPLMAYLRAVEETDETARKAHLKEHARQIQNHISNLANKAYWDQFTPTPEFVVLFIPGENFFSAALEQSPDLIEEGVQKGVILATPTTLISLLKAVSYGWRQEKMAENAQRISEIGKMLHERILIFAGHLNDVGRHLDRSVQSYNKAVGSLESRVLPATRRFEELGISSKGKIEPIGKLDRNARTLLIDEKETPGKERS